MSVHPAAFLVITCEASLPELWAALRTLRSNLPVSRVYWHPDERFRDGRHFRIEIPTALLAEPAQARSRAEAILAHTGLQISG